MIKLYIIQIKKIVKTLIKRANDEKFHMKHVLATLLAEPLFLTSNCDLCSLGMDFTDLMASMIVFAVTEIRVAPVHKA